MAESKFKSKVKDDGTLEIEAKSREEEIRSNPKRTQIKKGMTKIDTAPLEIQRAVLLLDDQGLAKTAIESILHSDYNYDVTAQTIRKYLLNRHEKEGLLYGSEKSVTKLKDDYMTVLGSLLDTHKKLKLSLDKAIEAQEWSNVARITKIMNDNVSTASDIMKKLPETVKDKLEKDVKKQNSVGKMLETM